MRFFKITHVKEWRFVGDPLYAEALKHSDVAASVGLPVKRVLNARFREIEQTGEYFMIEECGKGGACFIFEVIPEILK